MPIIKSSKKRAKQITVRSKRNSRLKRDIRTTMRELENNLSKGNKTEITNTHSKLNSLFDTASKKNIFHKNKAARRKSQVAKMVKNKTVKTTTSKTNK